MATKRNVGTKVNRKGAEKAQQADPSITVQNMPLSDKEITRVRDEIHAIIDKIPEPYRSAAMGVAALEAFHALLRPEVPTVHGLSVKALSQWNKG